MTKSLATKLAVISLAFAMLVSGCSSKPAAPKLSPAEAGQVRQEAENDLKQAEANRSSDKASLSAAQQKLEQVVVATPQDAKAQFLLGVTYYNQNQLDKAAEAYKKAITIDAKYTMAYNNLGNTYRDMKQYDEAVKWYTKATETDPTFVSAYTNLATMYSSRGRADDAVSVMQEAIAAIPANLDIKLYVAVIYQDAGQKDKALAVINDFLKAHPDYQPAKDLAAQLKK